MKFSPQGSLLAIAHDSNSFGCITLYETEFGERIGVTKSTISLIERKLRNPSERVIRDICREFNVNEDWLRNGTGEMFIEVPEEAEFEAAAAELSKNNDVLAMQAVIQYWKLDEASREAVRKYVKNLCDNIK